MTNEASEYAGDRKRRQEKPAGLLTAGLMSYVDSKGRICSSTSEASETWEESERRQ